MVGTVSLVGFEILGEAVEHDGNSRANLETGTIHKKMGSLCDEKPRIQHVSEREQVSRCFPVGLQANSAGVLCYQDLSALYEQYQRIHVNHLPLGILKQVVYNSAFVLLLFAIGMLQVDVGVASTRRELWPV